jgi:predicted small metal-binding protein
MLKFRASTQEVRIMAKVLRCREVGMDCDFVARGDSEQEVLGKAAEHARKDHGMTDIPPEVLTKVKAAVHDEA